ncbi:TetR-like C-terminal domain-containing protein [Pseudonocardia sp. HH130629-09]|uniref:TetR-like C-terminal domain-containing protein n=1 Tax=Pseudonocardia sp. HH130629-09 TaxID=1641402 RepID=UPI001EE77A64|nr:TetR-like C-terminal domain-containing protein [Pseudonocardia sp. HH130629-09]
MRAEVLAATRDLLFVDGLPAVTFERVATTAGASRTTLHTWWPTPGALAAEAYFAAVAEALDFPDTGDVQADVRTQLRAFVRLMTTQPAGRAARQLIGAAQTDSALREAFIAQHARPRRDEAFVLFRRAQERGQIREDLPLGVLVDQLWGPLPPVARPR